MYKIIILSLVIFLSGCYSAKEGLSDKTVYYPTDYNGERLRGFSEYDFFSESAPCTALYLWKPSPTLKEKSYVVVLNNKYKVVFECRDNGSSFSAKNFRLFLVGTPIECMSRTWLYSQSLVERYKRLDDLCKNGGYTRGLASCPSYGISRAGQKIIVCSF